MSTPRFTKGELVWRPVVCSRDREVRNKLILDVYPHAFDSFGIELLCRRIKDAKQVNEINGKKIYALNLEQDVVKIQKVCNNAHHDPNDQTPRLPLYFPRPFTFNNVINMDTVSDFAYLIQLSENMQVRGHLDTLYVFDPLTNMISKKEILDITFLHNNQRSVLIVDGMHQEPLSRFLRGAIHGEVRAVTRLYRIIGNTIPPSAAIFGPAVGSNSCPVYSSAKNSSLTVPPEDVDHQVVAVKTVRKAALRPDLRGNERPMDEIGAMYHIHHTHGGHYSNIVQLLHCVIEDYGAGDEDTDAGDEDGEVNVGSEMDVDAGSSSTSRGTRVRSVGRKTMEASESRNPEGNAFIIMPFYNGGELFDEIPTIPRDYYRVHDCFRQIALGISFIHAARFNHRDLSCENILIHRSSNSQESFHVIDFGMSIHIPAATHSSTSPLRTSGSIRGDGKLYGHRVCGKPLYIPAEHFLEKDPDNNPTMGFPSDVWALGVVLFILLTGTGPFLNPVGISRDELRINYVTWLREIKYDAIGDRRCQGVLPHTGKLCLLRDHPCYALLKRMLSWPEGDRINIQDVLSHDWVQNGGRDHANSDASAINAP